MRRQEILAGKELQEDIEMLDLTNKIWEILENHWIDPIAEWR